MCVRTHVRTIILLSADLINKYRKKLRAHITDHS